MPRRHPTSGNYFSNLRVSSAILPLVLLLLLPPLLLFPLGLSPSPGPPNLLVRPCTDGVDEEIPEEISDVGGGGGSFFPLFAVVAAEGEVEGSKVQRLGDSETATSDADAVAGVAGEGGVGSADEALPLVLLLFWRKLPNLLALSFPGVIFLPSPPAPSTTGD